MSIHARPAPSHTAPPLSWPPPGTERLQGTLWRGIGLSWTGSLILVLPLLWALAVEQPFYSLGPFEDNWELGMAIAAVGAVLIVFAFAQLWMAARGAAAAAELGYGLLTILEVATDVGRDTGFLIQGKRHFAFLDEARQKRVIRSRLLGGAAAPGRRTVAPLRLRTRHPARRSRLRDAVRHLARHGRTERSLLVALGVPSSRFVRAAWYGASRRDWNAQEGMNRIHTESAAWNERLDQAGEAIALGAGRTRAGAGTFRTAAAAGIVAPLRPRLWPHRDDCGHDGDRPDPGRDRGADVPRRARDGGRRRGAAPVRRREGSQRR